MPTVRPRSIRCERDEVLVPCRCTAGGPSPAVTTWTRRPDGRGTNRPCAPAARSIVRYTSATAGVCRCVAAAVCGVFMHPRSAQRRRWHSSVLEPVPDWDGALAGAVRLLLFHQGHRAPRRPVEPAHRASARGVWTAALQRAEPFAAGSDLAFGAYPATQAAGNPRGGLARGVHRLSPDHGRRWADAGALLAACVGGVVAARGPGHGGARSRRSCCVVGPAGALRTSAERARGAGVLATRARSTLLAGAAGRRRTVRVHDRSTARRRPLRIPSVCTPDAAGHGTRTA